MTLRPFAITTLLAAVAVAGCATTTEDPNAVTVGTEAAYPPFEDLVGGEFVGFDIDVIREIGNRSGWNVTFQNAAFDDIIPSVASGQFDIGASAFTITEARQAQVDFSVPYYRNDLMVATADGDTSIASEEDLQPATVKVCTQAGTTSENWLREQGYDNQTMVLLPAFPSCGEALKRGDVQALMIDRAAVRDLVAKSNGEIQEAFTISVDEQFGFAVQKGNGAILTRINTALNGMRTDGTLQQLMDKWNV